MPKHVCVFLFKGYVVVYRALVLGEDKLGREEKAHIHVADVA